MLLSELEALVSLMRRKAKDADPHVLFYEFDRRDFHVLSVDFPYPLAHLMPEFGGKRLSEYEVTDPEAVNHAEPLEPGDYIFNLVPFKER